MTVMGLLSPRGQPAHEMAVIASRDGVIANAHDILRKHFIPATEVLYVHSDSIWYRDETGIRTAWMRWDGAKLLVISERGTPAEPSASVVRRFDAQSAPLLEKETS